MSYKAVRFRANDRLIGAGLNAPAMRKGEAGKAVRLVQQALIDLGYALPESTKKHGSPDGIFGKETKQALLKFQNDKGLASKDGVVGEQTMTKLDDLLFKQPWTPLPPIGGIGDADDPAGNTRQLILETLGSGHMSFMNFSMSYMPPRLSDDQNEDEIAKQWRVHILGSQYQTIAGRVNDFKIDVAIDTSISVAALYDPSGNVFKVSRGLEHRFEDRCLIVHEATHAVCDLLGKPLNALFSEMVAFVAEARFSRLLKRGPKMTGDSDAAKVYELADDIAQELSKGRKPKDDTYSDFGLKIQAHPDYSDFTYGMHEYNGVP
jgi:hypothetical protein